MRWTAAKACYPVGSLVCGVVVRVEAFGVFVDLGKDVVALLLVTHFEDGARGFEIDEYPQVGHTVDAVVVHHAESELQIRLSTRASDIAKAKPMVPVPGEEST